MLLAGVRILTGRALNGFNENASNGELFTREVGCVRWGCSFFIICFQLCAMKKENRRQLLLSEVGISGALSFEFKSIGESFVS